MSIECSADMASDIWTELGHLVLDARHNNTARERGEAARLTLLGKPTSRSPYIPVTQEVPWERLADVAISPDGCVAACGIEANGDKQIMEWTVASRQWICRIIDSTWAEMRVANLHYPSDSEDVAYMVIALDGKLVSSGATGISTPLRVARLRASFATEMGPIKHAVS